jgi:glycosyltransferase involved in cell wall biosynthesis
MIIPLCVGGVEHFLFRLFEALDRRRVKPSILFTAPGPSVAYFRRGSWSVDVLPRDSRAAIRAARRWLEARRIDVMVTSCFQSPAAMASSLLGVPHIWRCPGKPDVALEEMPANVRRDFIHLMSMMSDRILVNSRTVAATLAVLPRPPIVRIPNGIASQPPAPAPFDLRRTFKWAPDAPVVAMIAHVVPVKRHEDFIEAAARVRRRIPGCRFAIFGDLFAGAGAHTAYGRGLLSRHRALGLGGDFVFVHGETDLSGFLPQLDIVVHPTADDSLPNAVIEAMAAGRAVIGADGGGCRELIVNGRSGRLVPAKRPSHLASAIVELVTNPRERRRLGGNAARQMRRQYDIRRIAGRYADLFEDVVRARRRRSSSAGR